MSLFLEGGVTAGWILNSVDYWLAAARRYEQLVKNARLSRSSARGQTSRRVH
jgi:hypothetical protein